MTDASTAEKNKRYVLVMDANVDDRFTTCMLLQRFGCNIFTAHTADEAINFMNVALPSALIVDASLIDSVFLTRIERNSFFPDIPLIVLWSSPNAVLSERAHKGEFAAYLRKPLNVEDFYKVIQSVIEKGPRRNIRIVTYLMATLEDEFGESEGYVTNLSEHGMFFRTLEPRPINTRMTLHVGIKGKTVHLEAKVLYTTSFNEGPFREPGMGLKFEQVNAEDRELIKNFILERIQDSMVKQSSSPDNTTKE